MSKVIGKKMALGKKILLILVTVFLFHILINSYILHKSEVIREADDASRIVEGLRFHQELVNKEYKNVGANFLNLHQHPRFFPLMEGLTLTYLGKIGLKDINSMILFTNAFFLLILFISVFNIGSILYTKEVGLLAADASPPGKINWKKYLLTADYVVDKTGDLGRRGALEDIAGEFKKSLKENVHFFKEVATFKNSNGDSIFVYKNVKKLIFSHNLRNEYWII